MKNARKQKMLMYGTQFLLIYQSAARTKYWALPDDGCNFYLKNMMISLLLIFTVCFLPHYKIEPVWYFWQSLQIPMVTITKNSNFIKHWLVFLAS